VGERVTPYEIHIREIILGERIRALGAELLLIEDKSPRLERARIHQAVIHLTRASDRLQTSAVAPPDVDLETILRLSIERVRARRRSEGGLMMEGGVEEHDDETEE
jgi:hypothetical protein